MAIFRRTYNILYLLIVVSAFPVSIAASHDLGNTDPLICKFHETQADKVFTINCDHCNYFFDVSTNLSEKTIYATCHITLVELFARDSLPKVSYIFNSPRSPPII